MWRLSIHAGPPPPKIRASYHALSNDDRIFVPEFVENTDTRIFQMLFQLIGEPFTLRIDANNGLELDGHSWHAAALASAANCKGRVIWTGSPFVPPGALDYKYAVARAVNKHLVVLGSTADSVADQLPGAPVVSIGQDVPPDAVIVLGIESGPGLSSQTVPLQFLLRKVAESTQPKPNETLTRTKTTLLSPVNVVRGAVTKWQYLDAQAAVKPWLHWLRSYQGSYSNAAASLRSRLQTLVDRKEGLNNLDIARVLGFKRVNEETPRSKL